jgi:hypothetical protein
MHPKVQALIAQRKAQGWPTRRGIHGTGDWSTPLTQYQSYVSEWVQCGFNWVKLLAGGDSQVNFCRYLRDAHVPIIPVIRLYNNDAPNNHVDDNLVKQYMDVGVTIFESTMNEFYFAFENRWKRNLPVDDMDWAAEVANGWAQQANVILRAGGVPTTPAIETGKWAVFSRFYDVMCRDYADLLKQSILALHNRPLNHPPEYHQDPDCWLGWQDADTYIFDRLGEHMAILSTEAWWEPGWNQDNRYPAITPGMHATYTKTVLSTPVPDYYLGECGWLWDGSGAWDGAKWKNNTQHNQGQDLPVIAMLKTWTPDAPSLPPGELPDPFALDDAILAAVKDKLGWDTYPYYTKIALTRGYLKTALTDEIEVQHGGKTYLARLFGNTILWGEKGKYTPDDIHEIKLNLGA